MGHNLSLLKDHLESYEAQRGRRRRYPLGACPILGLSLYDFSSGWCLVKACDHVEESFAGFFNHLCSLFKLEVSSRLQIATTALRVLQLCLVHQLCFVSKCPPSGTRTPLLAVYGLLQAQWR